MNHYERLVTKQAELSTIVAKLAAENRAPSAEEKTQLDGIQAEVKAIRQQFEDEGRKRFAENLGATENKKAVMLKKGESLEKHVMARGEYSEEEKNLDLGKILKGITFGDWSGATLERKAMAEAGSPFIPAPVAARVIDLARNQARVFEAGCQTIPMSTLTLKIPRLTADVAGSWVAEGTDITVADATFDSITFTAHKLAVLCAINNELIDAGGDGASSVSAAIENSIAKAAALALDSAALVGDGSGASPTGLVHDSGISTIATIGAITNWDKLADGAKTIRGYNFEPNAYIISPATYKMFDYLKDTLYQPLRPQSSLDGVAPLLSNQAASGYYYMGKFDEMAMGLRAGMRLEVSREGSYVSGGTEYNAFSKDQTLFRLVIRCDFQRLHSKAFVVGSGITVS